MSLPNLPHGRVLDSINLLAYTKDTSKIVHEKTKRQMLEDIRAVPRTSPQVPDTKTRAQYRAVASTDLAGHRAKMHELRREIDSTVAHSEQLSDVPKRSALKKAVHGAQTAGKIAGKFVKVALFSIPGDEPRMKRAMQKPVGKDGIRGTGKDHPPGRLLGQEKLDQRSGQEFLKHAQHTRDRARELAEAGPEARLAGYVQKMNERRPQLTDARTALTEAFADFRDADDEVRGLQHEAVERQRANEQGLAEAQRNLEQITRQYETAVRDTLENPQRQSEALQGEISALILNHVAQDGAANNEIARLRGRIETDQRQVEERELRIALLVSDDEMRLLTGGAAQNGTEIERITGEVRRLKEGIAGHRGQIAQQENGIRQRRDALDGRRNELQQTEARLSQLLDMNSPASQAFNTQIADLETRLDQAQRLVETSRNTARADADGDRAALQAATDRREAALGVVDERRRAVRELLPTAPWGGPFAGQNAEQAHYEAQLGNAIASLDAQIAAPDPNTLGRMFGDPNLAADLRMAREMVADAERAVHNTRRFVGEAERQVQFSGDNSAADRIFNLSGYTDVGEVPPDQRAALNGARNALAGQMAGLQTRLGQAAAPRGDALPNADVFQLATEAIHTALAPAGGKADPARAAAVLAGLARPDMSFAAILGGGPLHADTRAVLHTIADLPRGVEILSRILGDGSFPAVTLREDERQGLDTAAQTKKLAAKTPVQTALRTGALRAFLRADKALVAGGAALNASSTELLNAGKAAAARVYANPDARLTDAERAAFSSARSGLLAAGAGSKLQEASEQVSKAMESWIPRGLEREERTMGRVGQGDHTGLGKFKNLLPTTGKTPFNKKTYQASETISTAYSLDPVKTGKRIDDYIGSSLGAAKDVALALMRDEDQFPSTPVLIGLAAAEVAKDKTAAAKAAGGVLRPEHAVVMPRPPLEDLTRSVLRRMEQAFTAVGNAAVPPAPIDPTVVGMCKKAMEAKLADLYGQTDTGLKDVLDGVAEVLSKALQGAPLAPGQGNDVYDHFFNAAQGPMVNGTRTIAHQFEIAAAADETAVKRKLIEFACSAGMVPNLTAQQARALTDTQVAEFTGEMMASDHPLERRLSGLLHQVGFPLPDEFRRPLMAENLAGCIGALADSVPQPDALDEAVAAKLRKAAEWAGRLEDTVAVREGDISLKSKEDVYKYLVESFEQFELRGKKRLTSGGNLGVNVKPVQMALNDAAWLASIASKGTININPRIRAERTLGRNAVFEISMSTVGFEIFVGTEKRKSWGWGGGLGASFGKTLARGGVSYDKGRAGDTIDQEGVKFMIPRSPTKEYSDNDMRMEAKKLLDAIFHWEDQKDEHGNPRWPRDTGGAKDVAGIPANIAAIQANCPHVTVNVVDNMSEQVARQETGLGLSGSTKQGLSETGGKTSIGVGAGLGVRINYFENRHVTVKEGTGYHLVERNNNLFGGEVMGSGNIGPSTTLGSVNSGDGGSVRTIFGANIPGRTHTRQLQVHGADVKFRHVTVDGKTHAVNTRKDREHTNVSTLRQSLAANREALIELGVREHPFVKGKDMPLEEKRRVVGLALDEAVEICARSERTEEGATVLRNVFAESFRITDNAAAQFDALRCKESLARAKLQAIEEQIQAAPGGIAARLHLSSRKRELGAQRDAVMKELRGVLDAQNALLLDGATWMPWKVTASERTQYTESTGVDFFLRAGTFDAADGQRPILSWPV